jgi:hypothetical protein
MGKDDSDTAIDGTLGHQFNKRLFYWRIFKENHALLWFLQKSAKQENSSLFMNSIL